MCRLRVVFPALLLAGLLISCGTSEKDRMTEEFKTFLAKYESKVVPLNREAALAYFNATISGAEADYTHAADLEVELTKVFADKEDFKTLKRIRDANVISDPLLRRQLDALARAVERLALRGHRGDLLLGGLGSRDQRLCSFLGFGIGHHRQHHRDGKKADQRQHRDHDQDCPHHSPCIVTRYFARSLPWSPRRPRPHTW